MTLNVLKLWEFHWLLTLCYSISTMPILSICIYWHIQFIRQRLSIPISSKLGKDKLYHECWIYIYYHQSLPLSGFLCSIYSMIQIFTRNYLLNARIFPVHAENTKSNIKMSKQWFWNCCNQRFIQTFRKVWTSSQLLLITLPFRFQISSCLEVPSTSLEQ